MLKKVLFHAKRGIKLTILFIISTFLIVGAVAFLYKPTYSVWLEGEHIGYTENKSKLQHTINDYIEKGDEENQNMAFIQIATMPEYKLCLLKKGIIANDNEIIEKVKEGGTPYFRYYAILENNEEKLYVANFSEAENIVNTLKEKKSTNIENITISEKYETNMVELATVDESVEKLFVKPVEKPVVIAKNQVKTSGSYNGINAKSMSLGKVDLGISLIRPISGIITSRFGSNSRVRTSTHKGLDIAASLGTPIKAAAAGTVTYSGRQSALGNMVIITHPNGVQTCYCHCNTLIAVAGQAVEQGQTIATVGSTGNSTGPHLHLEIRVNGVAYNPQNYLY